MEEALWKNLTVLWAGLCGYLPAFSGQSLAFIEGLVSI